VKIRDTIFVHAGLLPEYAQLGIDEINKGVGKYLSEGAGDDELLLNNGPHWTRMYAN